MGWEVVFIVSPHHQPDREGSAVTKRKQAWNIYLIPTLGGTSFGREKTDLDPNEGVAWRADSSPGSRSMSSLCLLPQQDEAWGQNLAQISKPETRG